MKIKLSLIALIGLLSGCASMHTTVFEKIHQGDSQDKVTDLFGTPDSFGPSQLMVGAQAWYYTKGADICAFTIMEKVIQGMNCVPNPNHVSAGRAVASSIAAGAKGFNDAAQRQQPDKSLTCTSNNYTGTVTTTCH